MAKVFQEDINIQPQTFSTGKPQLLMSLGETLDNFTSQTAQIAAQSQIAKATVQGKQAASNLQAGESPEFKEETFIGGIAKKAYNSALRSSYVASVDRDLTLKLNELKTLHGSDLTAFNDAANAEIKGALAGVDPLSREMVMTSTDNFMASAQIEVQKATVEREMKESDETLITSADYFSDEAGTAAFNGDDLLASESLVKVFNLNQSRVDSGAISATGAALLNDAAVFNTKVAKNRGELNKTLQLPNGIQLAAGAIGNMIEKPLKGLTKEQNDEMVTALQSDLSRYITNQNRQEVEDQGRLTTRQNTAAANFAVDMTEGLLTQESLNKAARNGEISPTQYNTLSTKLSTNGLGVTDISLKLDIQASMAGGLNMTDAIVANMGVHLTQADAGELLRMQSEYSNNESVLNTNNAKRARTYLTESIKVTGLMGRLTDDASRKTAAAVREFDTRVLAGEDPMVVADDLYGRDSLTKLESTASNQQLNTGDIDSEIKRLTDNFKSSYFAAEKSGNANEMKNLSDEYNQQSALLKNIRSLQISQKQFDDQLKRVK